MSARKDETLVEIGKRLRGQAKILRASRYLGAGSISSITWMNRSESAHNIVSERILR